MAMLMLMQKLDSHYKLFTLLYRMENKDFFSYRLLLRSHVFCDGISQYKLLKVVICGVNIGLYAHVLKQFTSLVSLSHTHNVKGKDELYQIWHCTCGIFKSLIFSLIFYYIYLLTLTIFIRLFSGSF